MYYKHNINNSTKKELTERLNALQQMEKDGKLTVSGYEEIAKIKDALNRIYYIERIT